MGAVFTAAVLALTLNYSAYISEVYRGGIQAIARGQHDAAVALGMTHALAMRRIILPQAIRIVIPTLGNYFISLFKDTALCSVVSIQEVVFTAQIVAARNFQYFTLYTVVGAMYFLVSFPAARLVGWLERRTRGHPITWAAFNALLRRHPLPRPRIVHQYAILSEALP